MRRTNFTIILLTVFLLGLVAARRLEFSNQWGVCFVLLGLIPLLYPRFKMLSLLSLIVLCFLLGLWRGTEFRKLLLPYDQLVKQKVTVLATASSDSVYADKGQLSFDASNLQIVEPSSVAQKLVGTIAVKGYGVSAVYKGDRVLVESKLYPTRGSRQAIMSYSKIEVVSRGGSVIDNLRRKFSAGLNSAVPEPMGSFGLGLLIGQRTTLPEVVSEQLSIVGLTHIVAVSGYNLTIIVRFTHSAMRRSSKLLMTITTLSLILIFLLITGFSASIVRAGIVSTLSILAWYYGRTFKPLMVLLLSAVITAGYFPVYIWSDIGWYLSFMAFYGVLVVGPLFTQRYFVNKSPKVFLQLVIETLAAQIMTLPLIMFIFGRLSVVALLANILVVPLVSLAMLFSFVAGLTGMYMPAIANWFSWPVSGLLRYMLDVAALLAGLPNASVNSRFNAVQLSICYLFISCLTVLWWKKAPDKNLPGVFR